MGNKLINLLNKFEEWVNGAILLGATGILFVNVILRYIFHNSTSWAEEAIRYIIIWVTFFGGSICARQGDHVGIELFTSMTPPAVQKALKILADLLSIIFLILLTYYGWLAMRTVIITDQRSPAMLMPMWIVYLALPLGSAFMAFRFICILIQRFKDKEQQANKEEIDLTKL